MVWHLSLTEKWNLYQFLETERSHDLMHVLTDNKYG